MSPDRFLASLKQPKPSYPQTNLYEGDSPACTIVSPVDAGYSDLASSLQKEMRDRSGITIPIVREDKAPRLPRKNLILLGNLNNSRVLFRLYGYSYTPADHLFPGNGGYLVQTIHDPWGMATMRSGYWAAIWQASAEQSTGSSR